MKPPAPAERKQGAPLFAAPRLAHVAWAIFDAEFYANANPAAPSTADGALLLAHYRSAGAAAGFSPNRWFDEGFYRQSTPEFAELHRGRRFASGFEHYCEIGFQNRSPHWLFDPDYYRAQNPKLNDTALRGNGFFNGYDHYLKHGASELRRAHPFFDPACYLSTIDGAGPAPGIVPYTHFLGRRWPSDPPEPRSSAAFDAAWYLQRYEVAAKEVRNGLWHSALHHYLAAGRRSGFEPLPTVQPAARRLKLNIDRPRHRNGIAAEPIMGHLDIVGWAAADHTVTSIDIYVDGAAFGQAHYGMRTEGVAAAFPDLTHALHAGFRFVSPTSVPPGRHRLRIVARGNGVEAAQDIEADFISAETADGPWSLRRRMPLSEAMQKRALLSTAEAAIEFVICLSDAAGDEQKVQRTLASLQRQIYPHWRLQAPDAPPASDSPNLYFVRLVPGDELGVDALLQLALHRLACPRADFLYSDERRIDPGTGEMAPYFKPDWSPELLLATDYIGRLWAASGALVRRVSLSPGALAEGDNHDLVLRLTECAKAIEHVPHVLCETAPADAAVSATAGAVQRALSRRGIEGRAEAGRAALSWRVRQPKMEAPRVSVIIPTAGTRNLIEDALKTLRFRTDFARLEVIVIDTVPGAPAPWKASAQALADRIIEDAGGFNWSRLNNRAAEVAGGEVLLFLNDDVALPEDAGDPGWLRLMVEQLALPGVGIVGPQLLYPGGLVQQAGMFLDGRSGRAAFAGLPGTAPGRFGLALTQRNVSAVTGACLMVRRATFHRLGGFDERLDVACNDTDFCLRCLQTGLRVVYTPHAALIHHESVSRAGISETANAALFADSWRDRLAAGDPYFGRHLSRAHSDYRPDPEFAETIYPARPLARADEIARILVIKLDRIGDYLLSLPALRHLRRFFGGARITLLAAPDVCLLAANEAAIDDTIEFAYQKLASGGGAVEAQDLRPFAATLQAARFDLAIDLRCHTESRPILELSGATWRAGFDPTSAFPWLDIVGVMEPDLAARGKRTHMADTLADFAAKVTACFEADDERRMVTAAGWPAALSPPGSGVLRIAIHAGAGAAIKRWPAARFAALIDALASACACWIVLVGGADEADIAAEILSRVRRATPVSAVGSTSLEDLSGLIADCDLFIGNDSGPKHLAAALGVRTIGIHSGVVDAREWGASGDRFISIRRRTTCSPCYLTNEQDCPRAVCCLGELTEYDVMKFLSPLLSCEIATRTIRL